MLIVASPNLLLNWGFLVLRVTQLPVWTLFHYVDGAWVLPGDLATNVDRLV